MERLRMSVLSLSLLLLAGCGGGAPPPGTSEPSPTATGGEVISWPRPSDPMALARQAGLTPDTKEYLTHHMHAHLDVFLNGVPVEIPGGIGIEIGDPAVQKFDATGYGRIPEAGCEQVCISPLHTHDVDGVIHVEAQSEAQFTLGQFFEELAIRLDASCVDEHCAPDIPVGGLREWATAVGGPC